MPIVESTPHGIAQAAQALRSGELVAFPTETVYGLGARADDPRAVRRIFTAKGRPADHPLIVHLADPAHITRWARDVPPTAVALARAFWPGPLTLILDVAEAVDRTVTGGHSTIGIRVPGHPIARELIAAAGVAVAAPSANRFGRISPTTAAHVEEELGEAVAIILDGGPCERGLESTIVDLTGAAPRVLRPGPIRRDALEAVLGGVAEEGSVASATRAPGTLAAHYAPRTPLRRFPAPALMEAVRAVCEQGLAATVLARTVPDPGLEGVTWLSMPNAPETYAAALYARLREADKHSGSTLLLEAPPETPYWVAVNDRLGRAVVGSGGEDVS